MIVEENNEKQNIKFGEKEKKPKKLKKVIVGLLILILLLAISAFVWYNISLTGTGISNEEVTVEISIGSGTNKIAEILKENGAIKSTVAFKIYTKLNNITSFQAGTYKLTKDMSVQQIVEALQTGKVLKEDKVKITFIEGKSMTYVAKQIAENSDNSEEDVYALMKDDEYIESLIKQYWFITNEIKKKDIYYSLEGYLFPDTYSFADETATVKEVFKTMLDKMEKVLEDYKQDVQNSKYTAHEILTIASVIEDEGLFDKDKKNISSVIYNRLKTGMSLGCDATTYYAFKIELGSRDLYKSELNKYNPYNTRGPNMAGRLPVRANMYAK